MKVIYSSNNSGGFFWIDADDIAKMEADGWKPLPHWCWVREADSIDDAKWAWAALLNMNPDEVGCECCGPPHDFRNLYSWEEKDLADDDA